MVVILPGGSVRPRGHEVAEVGVQTPALAAVTARVRAPAEADETIIIDVLVRASPAGVF